MIYENKILPRLEASKPCDMTDILLKMIDFEIMGYCSCDTVDELIQKESKNILIHYLQSSDLLQFLSSAAYHNASSLKYKLEPPLTTSKMDCEYILNCLVRAGYVLDFSYSSLTTAFWIELNSHFCYTINEVLNIGISELIESKYDVRFDVEMRSKTDNIWADVFIGSDKKITIFHIELAAGLETDISTHLSQLEKLKNKIVKAKKRKAEYLSEFVLITPTVLKQLPSALQQADCIITIDNIQTKLNSLDL